MKTYRILALFLLPATILSQDWSGTSEIIDGTLFITNPKTGIWEHKTKIEFEEILRIWNDNPDSDLLAEPVYISTDTKGNIYIYDNSDVCIKVFDNQGRFLRRIGRKGQGPGEFEYATAIDIIQDSLICAAQYMLYSTKIHLFNINGGFKETLLINNVGADGIHYNKVDNSILMTTRSASNIIQMNSHFEGARIPAICNVKPTGESLPPFGTMESAGMIEGIKHFARKAFVTMTSDTNYIVTYSNPYRIDIYDNSKQRRVSITKEGNDFRKPEVTTTKNLEGRTFRVLMEYSYIKGVYRVSKDIFLLQVQCGNQFKMERYFDFFRTDGIFLLRIPAIEKEWIGHADDSGNMYTTGFLEDIPVIRKYKIKFVSR